MPSFSCYSGCLCRRKRYGRNQFPEPESQTWLEMFIESFADTTLIVLIVSAVVSLAVGLYEDPGMCIGKHLQANTSSLCALYCLLR
jgi:magnesium-transporting ATPase (P-type)